MKNRKEKYEGKLSKEALRGDEETVGCEHKLYRNDETVEHERFFHDEKATAHKHSRDEEALVRKHSSCGEAKQNHTHKGKSEGKILLAFILNLGFSVFELLGGIFAGSVAVASDAVHDFGDALSIGLSWLLERKSRRAPDSTYTYGYGRFSVLGALITNIVLLTGSVTVIVAAVKRLINSTPINYSAMIIFAVVGVTVNFAAALITSRGDNLNQKAINLHMLEDVLGWVVVLVGAVVMRFTDLWFIDSLMSVGVSLYMLWHVAKNLREIGAIFLIRIPDDISVLRVEKALSEVDGVESIHHVHIWSIDSESNIITLHIVTDGGNPHLKEQVRSALGELNITHITMELESPDEECAELKCYGTHKGGSHHHHHHHHGHSH